jgi:hypothetical protein
VSLKVTAVEIQRQHKLRAPPREILSELALDRHENRMIL